MKQLLVAVVIAVVVGSIAGCASVPDCERLTVSIQDTDEGRFFILDEANWFATLARQRDLQAGRCKLPPRPVQGTPT